MSGNHWGGNPTIWYVLSLYSALHVCLSMYVAVVTKKQYGGYLAVNSGLILSLKYVASFIYYVWLSLDVQLSSALKLSLVSLA